MVNLVLYGFTKPLPSLTIAAMIIPIQLPLIVSKKLMYKKLSSIANIDEGFNLNRISCSGNDFFLYCTSIFIV
jgi:hypothetical protein